MTVITQTAENVRLATSLDLAEPHPLSVIIKSSRLDRDEERWKEAWEMLSTYVKALEQGTITVPEGTQEIGAILGTRTDHIDAILSTCVNQVLHSPKFQRLEASWRGLHYLVRETPTSPALLLAVLPVTKEEMRKDLAGRNFKRSALFNKIYAKAYGIFEGVPFMNIVGDYEWTRHPEDIALVKQVAKIASAAHAPLLSGASPNLFDMDRFTELDGEVDLHKRFAELGYAKWNAFRETEDARYVALTVGHMLGRLPYGEETDRVQGFPFEEETAWRHDHYVWVNAAYALAARITSAFAKHSWCAAIQGVEGGGLVTDLPVHTFTTDRGDIAMKSPTEVDITETVDTALSELGFIALVHGQGKDYAVFFETRTVHKPKLYDTDEANANAFLSNRLQYMMAVSRIAHYLKAIARDKGGSFTSRKALEDDLNRWFNQNYVLATDDATQEMKAKKPLRQARVEVSEVPGKPGVYTAVCFLKPQFQLVGLSIALRLVAELPKPARREAAA